MFPDELVSSLSGTKSLGTNGGGNWFAVSSIVKGTSNSNGTKSHASFDESDSSNFVSVLGR